MLVLSRAGCFTDAIIDRTGRWGSPLNPAVPSNKRKYGILARADLDLGCVVTQSDASVPQIDGVDAQTTVDEKQERECCNGKPERKLKHANVQHV